MDNSDSPPKRPDAFRAVNLHSAIGRIASGWSGLEISLALILAELLETDHQTAMVVSAALDYRHHRDLITSLAKIKLSGAPSLQPLSDFLKEVKGMNSERNSAIHATWVSDPKTGRLMRITIRNQGNFDLQLRPVAPGHLSAVAEKILNLANSGVAIAALVRSDVKAWREKHPPTLPPHLIPGGHHPAASPDKP